MGILSITTNVAGQTGGLIGGVLPRTVKIVTSDNLATVTAAGYLNNVSLEGYNIFNTDIIDMWYGATGSQFGITSPGTLGIFTASIVNGVITLVPWENPAQELIATITSTQAQIQGADVTPVQLVAAPGAGNAIIVTHATVYTNFQTTPFAGGGPAIVQYGNTAAGAGTDALAATIPAAEITAAASQLYSLNGNTGNALTAISNLGLFFSNQTAPFTGGSAASTVVITLSYFVVVATV